jgi:hypothetical protein
VSAYRLVTGWYLPPVEARPEEEGPYRLEWKAPRSPMEMNPRVELPLDELILRMLARRPEERPSALELAEALEQASRSAGAGMDRPLFQREGPVAAVENSAPVQGQGRALKERAAATGRVLARARGRAWAAYAACAMLGAVVSAVALGWGMRSGQDGSGSVAQPSGGGEPVGLGDTELASPAANVQPSRASGRPGRPVPETPCNGQRRAPQCIPPGEVTIHGGCWIEVPSVKPPCGELGYEWNGKCYVPHIPPSRQPTSEPQ